MTMTEPGRPLAPFSAPVTRELHRDTLVLIGLFQALHFAMLTLRSVMLGQDHQVSVGLGRLMLVPISAAFLYGGYWLLRDLRHRRFVHQALAGAGFSTVAAIAHALIWSSILSAIDARVFARPLSYTAYQAFYWFLFYFAWTTAFLALCYSVTVREQERRAAALVADAQAATLQALRYQVNPHFLFNTLNAIAALIGEDAAKAEAMVLNLSRFFRSTLTVDPVTDVRLADEVALQQLYLEIERVRFDNRLTVAVEVPAPLADAFVPGLILQPLVENAIKHGVARSEAPTRLAIRASREGDALLLSVVDDARASGRGAAPDGEGMGLANVRQRLHARYGTEASLTAEPQSPHGFVATVRLPLKT